MPYVTEAHKINLIVEFSIQSDLKSIEMFFTNFEKLITVNKDAADKICLYAVYFNSTTEIYRYIFRKRRVLNRKIRSKSNILTIKTKLQSKKMRY